MCLSARFQYPAINAACPMDAPRKSLGSTMVVTQSWFGDPFQLSAKTPGQGWDFGPAALRQFSGRCAELGQPSAWGLGIDLANRLADMLEAPLSKRLGIVGQDAGH